MVAPVDGARLQTLKVPTVFAQRELHRNSLLRGSTRILCQRERCDGKHRCANFD